MTNTFVRENFASLYCDHEIAEAFSAKAFAKRMLDFEKAWTNALMEIGGVSKKDGARALQAIADFSPSEFTNGSTKDGLPIPSLIKSLRAGLSENEAKALHSGATSQDVIDSAMALTLIEVHEILCGRLKALLMAVKTLQERFGKNTLITRTRMQAALPATAEVRLDAWERALKGQFERADAARREINRIQVGGPIGSRTLPVKNLEEIAKKVSREFGLEISDVWQTDRSNMVTYGNWLTLLSGTLGKIGQDITLMAQQGHDEIILSDGGGSSAMPHKQNPIAAEAMVTLARFITVQQGALAQAMIHEQERSGSAWALEWLTLPAMAELTGASLNHCTALFEQTELIGKPA